MSDPCANPYSSNAPTARRTFGITLKRWAARAFWCFFFGLIAIALWMRFVESQHIAIRKLTIHASAFGVTTQKPVRIAQISDLHLKNQPSMKRFENVIEMLAEQKPDAIFVTGDTLYPFNNAIRKQFMVLFRRLCDIAPVYHCSGNHDYDTPERIRFQYVLDNLEKLLREAGVRCLINDRIDLTASNGQTITVVGFANSYPAIDLRPAEALKPLDKTHRAQDTLVLVFTHTPETVQFIKNYDWDIMFSGHTHGGQMRVPFTRYCPFSPILDAPFRGYTAAGLYCLEGQPVNEAHPVSTLPTALSTGPRRQFIYVTTGIGNFAELRFNSRPEIVIADIVP